jgi:hypothetical protein
MQIVRTLRVDAFVDDEVLTVFLWNQGMGTVRALKSMLLGKAVFLRAEWSTTNFTKDLSFRTIILVEIRHRSFAARTGAFLRDITFGASVYGFNHFTVTELVVFQKPLIFNFLIIDDIWENIGFEFLVLGRMAIIKSPLL